MAELLTAAFPKSCKYTRASHLQDSKNEDHLSFQEMQYQRHRLFPFLAVPFRTADLYEAVPIDKTRREIRLVNPQPGQPDDALHCTIQVSDLQWPLDYEALSYACGDQSELHAIYISYKAVTRPVKIGKNIWVALRRLRHREDVRTLWIDALCIHQSHRLEKSHQVQLMGDIYRAAKSVVVWLGDTEAPYELLGDELQESHLSPYTHLFTQDVYQD
jgi:hypothetical protein